MKRTRNLKPGSILTNEQIILAAINSEHPTIIKALEKLTFVIEMAHTQEELQELVDPFVRRIQAVFERGDEYKRYQFSWCGDEFEIINQETGAALTAGEGTGYGNASIPKEPVLVYVLDKD